MKHIAEMLETKACVKQEAYRNLKNIFHALKEESQQVISDINSQASRKDKEVTLDVIPVNDNEFHLKIAGDLLIFFMHTNIIMFEKDHEIHKSRYIVDNPMRKYFGQINVYNFMADSIKYNRMSDPGYLISRFFINFENHFLVEGRDELDYMSGNISAQPVSSEDISIFIQLVISQAIDSDLVTLPFDSIRTVTLHQKLEKSQALGAGQKIGFQMSYQKSI